MPTMLPIDISQATPIMATLTTTRAMLARSQPRIRRRAPWSSDGVRKSRWRKSEPEYRSDRAGYVKLICEEIIPRVAAEKLATFCDVFIENGAFTPDEARTIFTAAKEHGLRPKLHADQLADGGGAALAADVGAISADHLDRGPSACQIEWPSCPSWPRPVRPVRPCLPRRRALASAPCDA